MARGELFADIVDGRALAQAIVDTVREPLLVLDKDLRVVAASRSFYHTFQVDRGETQGRLLYTLGDGQWDISALRDLLENIVPTRTVLEDYEVTHEFPKLGRRIMLLNARQVFYEVQGHTTVLLAFEDVTERRAVEGELQRLLHQKELLVEEMRHRIANSLQIIASILLLKASTVKSEETRQHLKDAHKRVMSVAAVQQHLQATGRGERIAVAPYLSKLCETLAQSMIGDSRPIVLETVVGEGWVESSEAVSIGLIVTEAVINALKHAFGDEAAGGRIVVSYKADGHNWTLSIADNGKGKRADGAVATKAGLGTSIVNALAQQLSGKVSLVSSNGGTTLSIVHAAAQSAAA